MNWFLVFIGGGLGSLIRYALTLFFSKNNPNFPISTLLSNVFACFIIGILTTSLMKGNLSESQRLLWATGFCGGFSTFSTFSNETLSLMNNGQMITALLNIILSFGLCLVATFLGLKLMA